MKTTRTLLAAQPAAANEINPIRADEVSFKNVVVYHDPVRFAGWPANNGSWTWDDGKEILVGFTTGPYIVVEGHNIAPTNRANLLARSTDGGTTWTTEVPTNFAGNSAAAVPSPGEINFAAPGFAMKVMADGYHGHTDSVGSFFVSYDKGKNWQGPYRFNGLMEDPNLFGTECTSRTGYLVTGPGSCLVFMSARPKDKKKTNAPQFIDQWDKSYVAETTDGGKTFQFVSWIAPLSGPFRAVMPAVCRLKDGSIVATVRANRVERDAEGDYMAGHVDAYSSTDNGKTWTFLSRVGDNGGRLQNGNPPALVALKDGRIACAYGDRRTAVVKVRISSNGGKTWGDELVVRDDFDRDDKQYNWDMAYCRLVANHENKLVAMYYWATEEKPTSHIAATIVSTKTPPPPTIANLITDGDFKTTPVGNFTLSTFSATRSVWAGRNTATGDATLPVIGVTTGGVTGNCAIFKRGTTKPGWTSVFLYQRLAATPGLLSPSKRYKLTAKLKSGSTPSDGYFFIRHAPSTKLAVRADYSAGQTFAWRKNISSIPNTWTEYSQTFLFTDSVTTGTQDPTPSGTAFSDTEMTNLYVGFYSRTAGGTVYMDDVVLEEVNSATTSE